MEQVDFEQVLMWDTTHSHRVLTQNITKQVPIQKFHKQSSDHSKIVTDDKNKAYLSQNIYCKPGPALHTLPLPVSCKPKPTLHHASVLVITTAFAIQRRKMKYSKHGHSIRDGFASTESDLSDGFLQWGWR